MLWSDISRQLVDVEVLLAVVWHTGSELASFLDRGHFSSDHIDNKLT